VERTPIDKAFRRLKNCIDKIRDFPERDYVTLEGSAALCIILDEASSAANFIFDEYYYANERAGVVNRARKAPIARRGK